MNVQLRPDQYKRKLKCNNDRVGYVFNFYLGFFRFFSLSAEEWISNRNWRISTTGLTTTDTQRRREAPREDEEWMNELSIMRRRKMFNNRHNSRSWVSNKCLVTSWMASQFMINIECVSIAGRGSIVILCILLIVVLCASSKHSINFRVHCLWLWQMFG